MSIHEIEVVQLWNVTCACGLSSRLHSAGDAERLAIEHIEFVGPDGELIHYSHVVTIAQVTHVGRNP